MVLPRAVGLLRTTYLHHTMPGRGGDAEHIALADAGMNQQPAPAWVWGGAASAGAGRRCGCGKLANRTN